MVVAQLKVAQLNVLTATIDMCACVCACMQERPESSWRQHLMLE